MVEQSFKRRYFEAEILLICIRWDRRYTLSYRDPQELMRERGHSVDYTTIYHWVQRYAPERQKHGQPHLKRTTDL